MSDVLLVALSMAVIAVFGYRQFNQWTEAETRGDRTDSELLAFAAPRSFTSHWRFLMIAAVYCLTLSVFYLVLYMIFRSSPAAGAEFLKVAGVTEQNAWLVALFVVTGLSPIVPPFSRIERSVREVMHAWAVVPAKAQQMADELASPTSRIELDEIFLQDVVLARVAPDFIRADFSEERTVTVAEKWCRLTYLVLKLAPPSLGGFDAPDLRSPYTARFKREFDALGDEVREMAANDAPALRNRAGSPATLALTEKIDALLHRLYVLMACRAFSSARSLDAVVQHFRRTYGLDVRRIELAPFPTDPVFDALIAASVAVFVVSIAFWLYHPDERAQVQPFVWALITLALHGLGLLSGWIVFKQRKRRSMGVGKYFASILPISRKHLAATVVLGYSLGTIPTWLGSVYYLQKVRPANSLFDQAYPALLLSWPWAFLGAVTAVAVYLHLERTASREVSPWLAVKSGALQALANVSVAMMILAFYNAPGDTQTFEQKLDNPVTLLVLLLTGVIGLMLGLFLPRAVHGYGIDMRGGATRYRPAGAAKRAVFTCVGKQCEAEIQAISMTGCLLRLGDGSVRPNPDAFVTVVLGNETALPAQYVREAKDAADGATLHAFRFTTEQGRRHLPRTLRHRLGDFLRGEGFVPLAAIG